jgi:hypothetical protein
MTLEEISRRTNGRTSGKRSNYQSSGEDVLVVQDEELDQKLCQGMRDLSTEQIQDAP